MKHRLQRSVRVSIIGMVTNTFLAAGKMVAGVLGHSHALIADGIESLADILSSLVVWKGMAVAAEPADEDHPYGHGKAEPLAAAIVATMLLIAAGWIALQSIHEILRPHTTPAPFTLVVLVLVIILKEGLFRYVSREGAEIESSAIQADAWHHRSDAITSLCAGVGITVALVGGEGWEAADDWAALAASGIIAWNGWRLLRGAKDELMDSAPGAELVGQIQAIAETVEGVALVEKCLVRKAGYHHFVEMHVEVPPDLTVAAAHELAHRVKAAVCKAVPVVKDVLVHVEPAGNSARRRQGGTHC